MTRDSAHRTSSFSLGQFIKYNNVNSSAKATEKRDIKPLDKVMKYRHFNRFEFSLPEERHGMVYCNAEDPYLANRYFRWKAEIPTATWHEMGAPQRFTGAQVRQAYGRV